MSYATNVGKAISLQTPDRGDYWLRRAADDLRLEKQQNAKDAKDKADKLATVYDIDLKGGYLPAWGKAVKEEYATFVNTIAEMRSQDPNVSYAKLLAVKNLTKAHIEDLKAQNDAVVKYISNPKYMQDENWVSAAQTSDDFNEIAKHNNPTYYNVDPKTGYTFLNPVEMITQDIKWGTPQEERYVETVKRGNTMKDVYEMVFPQGQEVSVATDLKQNQGYRNMVAWQLTKARPELRKSPTQTLEDWAKVMTSLVDEEIQRRVDEAKPKPFRKEENVPKAGKGGASGKDKRKNYAMKEETFIAPIEEGKMGRVPVMTKVVKVTNTTNLTSANYLRDARNFQPIPETIDGKTLSFNFKPNKIIAINANGVKKLYASGPLISSDTGEASPIWKLLGLKEPDAKISWHTTQNILVPLDGSVLSLVEEENIIDDIKAYDVVKKEEPINVEEFN